MGDQRGKTRGRRPDPEARVLGRLRERTATRGTRLPNVQGDKLVGILASECLAQGEASLNGFTVYWYRVIEPLVLPQKNFDDSRSELQILMDAIAMVEPDLRRRNSMAQSANGKVGGALREAAGRPAIETFQAVRHRCEQWEHSKLLGEPH
jgi:hypothetical protein